MANRLFFLTHNHWFCLSSKSKILTIKEQNFKMNLFCKWLCTTENIKFAIQTCRTGTVSRGIWTHGESQLLVILKHHFVDESGLWRLSGGRNRTTFLSFDPRADQDNGIKFYVVVSAMKTYDVQWNLTIWANQNRFIWSFVCT